MIRSPAILAVAAAVTAALGGPGEQARRPPRPPRPPSVEERLRILSPAEPSVRHAARAAAEAAMLSPGAAVDVERYTIDLRVSLGPNRVDGSVRIEARVVTAGMAELQVGLYDQMQVVSVTAGGSPLSYTRSANLVRIALGRAHGAGEVVDVTVAYGGTPPVRGFGSFVFGTHGGTQPIVSSLSEPFYAPTWWPCVDDPSDKAIVAMDLTVPDPLVGVSNGALAATLANPDATTTYQWRSSYPISTYLVSVAISNYSMLSDVYQPVTGGPPMPVQHWVYPEKLAAAQNDFGVTVPMLEFFATAFGEYPFVAEKYGHALFNAGGAMEHQTATSYGAGLVGGDNFFDWIVAHELAHQWWGNLVTLPGWGETWLNEGFATYSEALWSEHLGGFPALRTYVASLDSRPFCGTLHDPPAGCDIFGHTIYDKGAWVLHMLRRVVGDAAFFQGLRNWASDHAYANGSTADLRAVMESASGLWLGDFFDRWVYQSGEPAYRWGWSAASTPAGWVTWVRIEQTQAGAVFVMPIDLRVATALGPSTFTVQNAAAAQDVALPPLPAPPTGVLLDPDLWILKSATLVSLPDGDADGVPDTADNCDLIVNAAQEDLDGDGAGDACDADLDGDGRDNALDCAPADPDALDPPGVTGGLDVAGSGSIASLSWEADPAAGPDGTYEVLRGPATALRLDGGVGGATCRAQGLTATQTQDADLPADDAIHYYLVRARNACGPGTLGFDSSGAPRAAPACP